MTHVAVFHELSHETLCLVLDERFLGFRTCVRVVVFVFYPAFRPVTGEDLPVPCLSAFTKE